MPLPQLPGLIPATSIPAAPSARVWSSYQEVIFDAFLQGRGNVVIEAVAGSGKSTTLVEGVRRWTRANPGKSALFVAFNRDIAQNLAKKVPAGCEAKTLHSACFGALKRRFGNVQLDNYKLDDTAKTILLKHPEIKVDCRGKVTADLKRAYGLLKGTMTDVADVAMCNDVLAAYDVSLDMPALSVPLLGELDTAMRTNVSRITFDEMISFVVDHNIQPYTYDLVCCDEQQDMSLLQIAILKKMVKPSGRFFGCGDVFQAIYSFRGADSAAVARIKAEFNVPAENELPLSITYRCPRSVVALAQEYVPHIQFAPGALEGQVITCGDTQAAFDATMRAMEPGDMGLCRANAPLVACALALISEGRRAVIKGRDIGASIIKLMKDLLKKTSSQTVHSLSSAVAIYQVRQAEKLRAQRKDAQASSVEDRCDTLMAIMKDADSLEEVDARIERLFSDGDSSGAVVFSSGHRAKGLEADKVVWIGPEISDWILNKVKTAEGRQAEQNVRYVIVTRAKKTLVIQPLPAREKEG